MSAIENMIKMVLNALDIDADTIKTEVTNRVQQFEVNVNSLNAAVTRNAIDNTRNAVMLERICEHLGLEVPPAVVNGVTAITGGANEPQR